ncbi:collagen alpha-1(XXV) chain-like isoform X1 [Acipenser ruthenus]|uniref:collagen alpha-1(XXV) chain-like isoform X1 n=1 Tax=Acipenser ruthenus TaxID=7906 RepID=UPI002742146D|nr:collagen alpha-1(XXV) chain-like isoform X1 [Acipenser ruthenus]
MDSTEKLNRNKNSDVKKVVPKSEFFRCLASLPTCLCFMMAVSSVAFCFLLSFKTFQLENRVKLLEKGNAPVFAPAETSILTEGGTLLPVIRDTIESILQERLNEALPRLRTARDLQAQCSCPPEQDLTVRK